MGENDSAFGMRVWSEGQGGTPVSDWEDRKVEEMLTACLAKYQAYPQMQSSEHLEVAVLERQDTDEDKGPPGGWSRLTEYKSCLSWRQRRTQEGRFGVTLPDNMRLN